ncbi:hypothetical protein VL20_1784 [Microcystis panniformis FACHB-1757]|uniref:Uncharacterized protein n=1 Tax=Microcystis panniformis FACHB-1757 TaxID=1638788 RepID=A0A0K1RYS1_9CHRO|nr:hypothetical protein VL20_1784 [Microcystis panniformis FACHB-1757]
MNSPPKNSFTPHLSPLGKDGKSIIVFFPLVFAVNVQCTPP